MPGTLRGAWPHTFDQIWSEIAKHEDATPTVWSDILREIGIAWAPPVVYERDDVSGEVHAVEDHQARFNDAVQDDDLAREFLANIEAQDFAAEGALVEALERIYKVFEIEGTEDLANSYRELVEMFVSAFNLRYEVIAPLRLVPTASGIMQGLVADISRISQSDDHLAGLLNDCAETIRGVRDSRNSNQYRSVIQRHVNLVEAIGEKHLVRIVAQPGGKQAKNWKGRPDNLGKIARGLPNLPHDSMRDAFEAIYNFTCDYPGIRHGGNPKSKKREIEMRDLVAGMALLLAVATYAADELDISSIYGWGDAK